MNDICPGARPLVGCHCSRGVYYFFMLQMPQVIKTALAKEKFNANTYKDFFQHADDVFNSNRLGSNTSAGVVAAVSTDADTTLPALTYPIEAVTARNNRGGRGGRGGRGNRGNGRGGNSNRGGAANSSSGQSQTPTTPANNQTNETLPPNLCFVHKKYKKQANHCRNPFVCEWAKFIIPRNN